VAGLAEMGIGLHPKEEDSLWTLNALKVPAGVDELAVRKRLLAEYGIEIGGGLGDLKGQVWRVGLMGYSSTRRNVLLFLAALREALGR
jgi:alanine-glyoxylate transaminase/serine-glyoxylate transaminase/serine-pyruvate transaminase